MRTDGKFDRKILSELFYQYINQEEDFVRRIFGMRVSADRTFVNEDKLKDEDKSIILDYEKASHIINSASCITVGTCYCRHKMEHVGKACSAPQEVCLTFNNTAESLSKHKVAKEISKAEAMKILKKCRELGLVQIGDNVQKGVNWICNCCGCCCEALIAYKKLGDKNRIQSNFFAKIDHEKCLACGICEKKCPVEAIKKDGKVIIDRDRCIGCGVCSRFCPKNCISMERKKKINYTPGNSFERIITNAIEENKLQDYIFDNYDSWTSELLRRMFGVIIKLTPKKILLVQEQINSRYLTALIKTKHHKLFDVLYKEGKKVK
jgi:Pyruvate/2-oxoacid:ferredoxin oxidoreductase delta subunit